jgi:hypothetical protein
LSRASLALAINHRLRRPVATDRTIAKIENGQRVDPFRYRPVLIELELAPEPSLEEPRSKQAPGEWVRELREAHGIPPTIFCRHAQYSVSGRRLSRSTLAAIEERRRFPSWQMVDAIATGFERSHVDIDPNDLDNAWIFYGGGPAIAAWGPEIIKLRERILVQKGRVAGAVAGLSVLASRLSHLTPELDNLIRIDEARSQVPRRALEDDA